MRPRRDLPAALAALTLCGTALAATPPAVVPLRPWRADLREPTRIALDAAGSAYVTDPRSGDLVVRAPDGTLAQRIHLGGRPVAVAVDGQGRVLVADAATGAVTAYDSDWQPVLSLGAGEGEYLSPSDLAVHPATGRIYGTDAAANLVRVHASDGTPLATFDGGTGDTRLSFPVGITTSGDEVWVTSQRTRHVVHFDLDGVPLGWFGRHGEDPGEMFAPAGLWLDDADRVWVVDARLGRVTAFDRTGLYLDHIGTVGSRTGELSIPGDAVLDPWSRLLVTSANNGRLELFGVDAYADPDGPPDTDADADSDADSDADTDTDADSDADSDADTDADSDTDADADGDADADSDADADGPGGIVVETGPTATTAETGAPDTAPTRTRHGAVRIDDDTAGTIHRLEAGDDPPPGCAHGTAAPGLAALLVALATRRRRTP